jgi:hypothetical protein
MCLVFKVYHVKVFIQQLLDEKIFVGSGLAILFGSGLAILFGSGLAILFGSGLAILFGSGLAILFGSGLAILFGSGLAILFRPFGFIALKTLIWLSNLSILSMPGGGCSRDASCALNLISTFLLSSQK